MKEIARLKTIDVRGVDHARVDDLAPLHAFDVFDIESHVRHAMNCFLIRSIWYARDFTSGVVVFMPLPGRDGLRTFRGTMAVARSFILGAKATSVTRRELLQVRGQRGESGDSGPS